MDVSLRKFIGDHWMVGPGIGELHDHPGLRKHLRKSGRDIHVWVVNTDRDLELCQWLDRLGFDEAWIGEHHSAGFETISSPELFIASRIPAYGRSAVTSSAIDP